MTFITSHLSHFRRFGTNASTMVVAAAPPAAAFRIRPSIVLFGDSITQEGFGVNGGVGWASLLAASYSRRADVLNRGFSGYNTHHALNLLPRVFGVRSLGEDGRHPNQTNNYSHRHPSDLDVLFCTVFFGANDAVLPGEPQHVPIDQYRRNLQRIVATIREQAPIVATTTAAAAVAERVDPQRQDDNDDGNGDDTESGDAVVPIILCTPPPICEEDWASFRGLERSDRTNKRARSYGACVKQVAATSDPDKCCEVLDIWELLEGDAPPEIRRQYLSDGLHLSELGNRRVFDGLMELVQTKYPHLAPMLDGEGKFGASGIPLEEQLWKELCGVPI